VAAEHLVQEGVPASAIQVEGVGTGDPQADNHTRKGRALNRRAVVAVKGDSNAVEIQVLDTDPVTKKVAHRTAKAPMKKSAKAHPARSARPHGKAKATIKKSRSRSRQ